jgi:PAS domain S-box-containing protein
MLQAGERGLVALAMVLVGINIGAAIWDMRTDRDRTERAAQRAASNLTRLLAEQTAASLDAVDLVLRDAQRDGGADAVAAAVPRLRDALAHIPQIAAILVLDRQGRRLAQTSELSSVGPDFVDQPFFSAHRDARAESVALSEPFRGGPTGTNWRFILSRRLDSAGGAFDGVIAAVLEIERFERLYETIDVGEGGFITLLTLEGVVITRVPDPTAATGRRYYSEEISRAISTQGSFEGWTTSPILNERVLLSSAVVRGFPLFVASGGTERAVFAPWREQLWLIGRRTLLTSAAMLLLIAVAAWGLRRRERALESSEKRFRAMIEHSADAVVLTHPHDGGIFYVSPAFERVTGYTLQDVAGKHPYELLHPDHRDRALGVRHELLRTPGKVVTGEYLVRTRDGSFRWVERTISNLLHEPSVNAFVLNLRDITERKQADAERVRLEQRLRQSVKMEAVGRLAGGIAHDFNNILGGILGYAELLMESAAEGSAQRRYAQNVLTAATRASDLVQQILSYSRSQRGKRIAVELNRIVAETLELVRGSLPAGVELEAKLPATPLFAVGDPTQLHQIVMNLCTNAIHAIGDEGRLCVTVDAADVAAERAFAHGALAPGRYAIIKVEDTGQGMDAETLAHLFEPFFTTKEVGMGTGLGLSLVYGIVTDSAGAIDVASSVGRGSCFTIYLPRVDSPASADDERQVPIVRGNGECVLVVDDEEALLAVTAELLKRLGYEPSAFADGAAALAAFNARPGGFDAVIADEVMPGLTGTELAESLHRLRPELPIVLVSGYIGPMMTERALAAGVGEILKKPVQSRDLAAALARVLRREDAGGQRLSVEMERS